VVERLQKRQGLDMGMRRKDEKNDPFTVS